MEAREGEGRPIRVGVVGAGSFGRGLIAQLSHMTGMRLAAVAEVDVERALEVCSRVGFSPSDLVPTDAPGKARAAVEAGTVAVVPDGTLLLELPLDAVVDCTGLPDVGADIADTQGVVYTLADGDQPSLICTLVDWAAAVGFDIVALAKRDLPTGTTLDGIGGRTVAGVAEVASAAHDQLLLPVGLAERVRLKRPIANGALVRYDDLEVPGTSACWRLRREHGLIPAYPDAPDTSLTTTRLVLA